MSELTLTPPPLAAAAPAAESVRWRFWGTLAWGIAALAAFYLTQLVALVGLLIWWRIHPAAPSVNLKALGSNAVVVSTLAIACLPPTLLVIALAVKLARSRFVDYVALKPIDGRMLLFALVCTIGYRAATDILTYVSGHPLVEPFVVNLYRTTREADAWVLMLSAVVIAAPILEELLFRGFLLRGLSASRIGAAGAVVLTSMIWALMHVQYSWLTVAEIFGLGLLLGYLRLRSGSTATTIVSHGVYNVAAIVQAAVLVG